MLDTLKGLKQKKTDKIDFVQAGVRQADALLKRKTIARLQQKQR